MRSIVVAAVLALLPMYAGAQPVSEAAGPDTYLQVHLGAFVPPRWFRRFINRAASYALVRRLVAPSLETTSGSLWTDLATTARRPICCERWSSPTSRL